MFQPLRRQPHTPASHNPEHESYTVSEVPIRIISRARSISSFSNQHYLQCLNIFAASCTSCGVSIFCPAKPAIVLGMHSIIHIIPICQIASQSYLYSLYSSSCTCSAAFFTFSSMKTPSLYSVSVNDILYCRSYFPGVLKRSPWPPNVCTDLPFH